MRLLLWAAVLLGGLYGLHLLALWAERRGLVYYRNRRGSSGTLGNALLEVQAIVEPSRRHVLEERVREPKQAAEPGAPPDHAP